MRRKGRTSCIWFPSEGTGLIIRVRSAQMPDFWGRIPRVTNWATNFVARWRLSPAAFDYHPRTQALDNPIFHNLHKFSISVLFTRNSLRICVPHKIWHPNKRGQCVCLLCCLLAQMAQMINWSYIDGFLVRKLGEFLASISIFSLSWYGELNFHFSS